MGLPGKWQDFYIGRKLIHPTRDEIVGVVKYATVTRLGEPKGPSGSNDQPSLGISSTFHVEWSDGGTEDMEDVDVARIATDEFVEEDWVMERILALQKCKWNEDAADAMMNNKKSTAGAKSTADKKRKASGKPPLAPRNAPQAKKQAANVTVCVTLADLRRNNPNSNPASPLTVKKTGTTPRKSPASAPAQAATGRQGTARIIEALADHASSTGYRPQSTAVATATSPSKKTRVTRNATAAVAASPPAKPKAKAVKSPAAKSGNAGASGSGTLKTRLLQAAAPMESRSAKSKGLYQFDEVSVAGVEYRVYSKDIIISSGMCYCDSDKTVATWKADAYNTEEEYLVDCIAAERPLQKKGKKNGTEFLIKYSGYEIDVGPESWLPLGDVDDTVAYDKMDEETRARQEELHRSQGVLPVAELGDLSRVDFGTSRTVTIVVDERLASRAQEFQQRWEQRMTDGDEAQLEREMQSWRPEE